jgi:hypothetical protein
LDPIVALDIKDGESVENIERAREFVRKRRTSRHNRAANAMLDGWIRLVAGTEPQLRLRAFDIGDGITAEFELMRTSGFSGVTR